MTARNPNVRFCQNNYAASTAATVTATSEVSGFEVDNMLDTYRYTKLLFQGAFIVSSSNKKIYINDGSDKTVTLTEATYASGTLMAAHIQTQLNASSTNWTCTYSNTTYKFTIGRSSGTRSLRFTQTTDAAWSMLGYSQVADTDSGTGLTASNVRIHTSEKLTIDMGVAVPVAACFIIWAADTDAHLSSLATVTLKGNNTNSFTSPAVSKTLTVENTGIFQFLDDLNDYTYRYWQIEIEDKTNPDGPQIAIHQLYMGDYVTTTSRNVNNGFQKRLIDPSEVSYSEGGTPYFRRYKRYYEFSNINYNYIEDTERADIEELFSVLGKTTPFFVSLDPLVGISSSLGELTKYVFIDDGGQTDHQLFNKYGINIKLREMV